jgi:hypothetical protein
MAQHINAAAVQLAVTTSSASVQLPPSSLNGVEIVNIGTAPAYVACGGSGVTASATTNRVVQPNWPRIFMRNTGDLFIAAITASGTATLVITPCSSDEQA